MYGRDINKCYNFQIFYFHCLENWIKKISFTDISMSFKKGSQHEGLKIQNHISFHPKISKSSSFYILLFCILNETSKRVPSN